jgi:uncharacterized protein (DUF2062 family)
VLRPDEPPAKKAVSLAVGLFWGLSPFWGFHTGGAILSAIIFRLNKPITILASNISIPPLIPVVIYISYVLGGWWLGSKSLPVEFDHLLSPDAIQKNLFQYFIGAITLATGVALLCGSLVYLLAKRFQQKKMQL